MQLTNNLTASCSSYLFDMRAHPGMRRPPEAREQPHDHWPFLGPHIHVCLFDHWSTYHLIHCSLMKEMMNLTPDSWSWLGRRDAT